MTNPAELKGLSPYAPPSVIQDEFPSAAIDPSTRISPMLTAAYALGVTLASVALSSLTARLGWGTLFAFWWLTPLLSVAALVVGSIVYFGNHSRARQRSMLWKIFMTIAVPPAAMLVFIPTCVGAGVLMMPLMSFRGPVFFIPMFFATWATCHTVATRMASRLVTHASVAASGPYHSITIDPPHAMPADLIPESSSEVPRV